MEKVVIWYSIQNGGDGSAGLAWYLSEDECVRDQEPSYGEYEDEDDEDRYAENQWAEPCYGSVETFIGSDIHKQAVANSK